jgi:hypothetical protein
MRSILECNVSAISQILPKIPCDGLIKPNGPRQIQLLNRKRLEELASR